MKAITIVMTAIFMFAIQTAEAHPHNRVTDKRQYHQHKRVQHGVSTGQLTHREATALRMQQVRIASYKQMARADGRVTYAERSIINRAQKQANKNIYHKKHNNNTRGCR